ncbi:hypothetical protein BK729_13895 [Bacillus thuringiensis serovar wratislaviensis]|nr:hypothetical protein BK729_13895 [Bacillus thuringiensis serovar wratislaviensis]OUB53474.1 hypothetical protein BK743_28715 [Bacillus thuringiensis serovar sylvestriensis]
MDKKMCQQEENTNEKLKFQILNRDKNTNKNLNFQILNKDKNTNKNLTFQIVNMKKNTRVQNMDDETSLSLLISCSIIVKYFI